MIMKVHQHHGVILGLLGFGRGAFNDFRKKMSRSASVVSLVQTFNKEGKLIDKMVFSPDGKTCAEDNSDICSISSPHEMQKCWVGKL